MPALPSRNTDESRLTVLGYGSYALLGWSSVILASLIGSIESAFNKTDADIGVILLFAAAFYGIAGLGGGFLTERIGSRNVLLAAFLFLTICMLGQGTINVWLLFAACVALTSLGSGAIDAGFGALFLEAFADRRSVALNHLHLFYGVGALISPALIGVLISVGAPWRLIYLITAAMALTGALAISRLHVRKPSPSATAEETPEVITATERSLVPFFWLAAAMMLYEAQVSGITIWIVRFLEDHGVGWATSALTAYWVGVSLSRLTASRILGFASAATTCLALLVLSSIAYLIAILSPTIAVTVVMLVIGGYLCGPIYPLILSIGGDMYPHRLSRLSGGMTMAATFGVLLCPPLIGFLADTQGIRTGLIGAALVGIPSAVAIAMAVRVSPAVALTGD